MRSAASQRETDSQSGPTSAMAGGGMARRLLSMAATLLSCFRWRPRPLRSRRLPPVIVVELKLHWRRAAAGYVAAEGAAEWEARSVVYATHTFTR